MEATIRILIADDHPLLRDGVRALVSAEPDMLIVGEAPTAEEAIAQYASLRPDVLVLDLRLPEAGGFSALDKIVAADPDARVLVFTTLEGDEDIHRALALGARGYVLKHEGRTQFIRAIRTIHAGKRAVGPAAAQKLADQAPRVGLTKREVEILELMARGLSNKEIGAAVDCTEGTVKVHVSHILGKLGADDRTGAVTTALQRGIIHLPG